MRITILLYTFFPTSLDSVCRELLHFCSNIIFPCPIWQMSRIWVLRFTKVAVVAAVEAAAVVAAVAKDDHRGVDAVFEVVTELVGVPKVDPPDVEAALDV